MDDFVPPNYEIVQSAWLRFAEEGKNTYSILPNDTSTPSIYQYLIPFEQMFFQPNIEDSTYNARKQTDRVEEITTSLGDLMLDSSSSYLHSSSSCNAVETVTMNKSSHNVAVRLRYSSNKMLAYRTNGCTYARELGILASKLIHILNQNCQVESSTINEPYPLQIVTNRMYVALS